MADITPADISSFVDKMGGSPRNRINYHKKASQLFNFARRQGYVAANPCDLAERVKADDDGEIGILRLEQVRALFESAVFHAPHLVPYVALGAFAGLRTSELMQLEWGEIDFDQRLIEVKGAKAKTRARRLVDVSDNLLAWLMAHRKKSGPIVDAENFRKEWEGLREKAGFRIFEDEKDEEKAKLPRWPSNALRHSCASYGVAKDQDLAKVALQMGHDVDVLVRHYRNLVTPKAAAEYWHIVPEKAGKKIIHLQKAG